VTGDVQTILAERLEALERDRELVDWLASKHLYNDPEGDYWWVDHIGGAASSRISFRDAARAAMKADHTAMNPRGSICNLSEVFGGPDPPDPPLFDDDDDRDADERNDDAEQGEDDSRLDR